MSTGLSLSYSSITVALTQFTEANWPRKRLNPPEISRTAFNTPVERGYSFEAPHIWQVSAILSDQVAVGQTFSPADNLVAMYDLWQQVGGDIVLSDYTRDFSEAGTTTGDRTRGLASGGSVTNSGNVIRYPATFNVRFAGELNLSGPNAIEVGVSFQLVETAKTTP
jgi:hypothetical protein